MRIGFLDTVFLELLRKVNMKQKHINNNKIENMKVFLKTEDIIG